MAEPPPEIGTNTLEARVAMSDQIWNARQQARQETVDAFDTVEDPRNVPIRRRGRGFGPAEAFLEIARPREAAADLDPRFPRQDIGPADVTQVEGGFRPAEPVRRRAAAFELEDQTALEDVDPQADLVARDDGFGLTGPRQRDLAAERLDPQFPDMDLTRQDVERTGGDAFGLTPFGERRVAAERIEDQQPLDEVAPSDIRRTDDGFRLRESVIEENQELFY